LAKKTLEIRPISHLKIQNLNKNPRNFLKKCCLSQPHKTAVKSITLRRTIYLCKAALSFMMLSTLPWQHDSLLVMIFACSQLSPNFDRKHIFFGIWNLSPKVQQKLVLQDSLKKGAFF